MATRKTTAKAPKTTRNLRTPRRPASRKTSVAARTTFNPVETVRKTAEMGLRLGIGTTLLLSENAVKFFNEALAKGNTVNLTVPALPTLPTLPSLPTLPTVSFERFEQLRALPVERLTAVRDQIRKSVEDVVKQASNLVRRGGKKQDINVEDEVTTVISKMNLPKKSELKEFSRRISELAEKVDKLAQVTTPA